MLYSTFIAVSALTPSKPVILMTHSQAGEFGWILGDSRPEQVKAIVALEPFGPPFINAVFPPFTPARIFGLTDIPVAYDPPITQASDIARVVVRSVPLDIRYIVLLKLTGRLAKARASLASSKLSPRGN